MTKILPITFSILLCILCTPALLLAQHGIGDQELSASYGITSGTDMIRGFSTSDTRPSGTHTEYNKVTSITGNIFLTYRFAVNRKLSVGITLGNESLKYDENANPINQPPILLGKYKASITTLAFEVKPGYYNGKVIQLYGLIGIGARYYHESADQIVSGHSVANTPDVFPNSQWTPIGVRAGKALSGFVEFGVGYKGLVNAGLCYKLTGRKNMPAKSDN